MGTRFTAARNVEEVVAAMARRRVAAVADDVVREVKAAAPPTKRFQTQEDPLVRETHFKTNGQEVPENLRFSVPSMDWDREHRGVGKTTYMLAPRDETSGAVANLLNCRCTATPIADGISRHVSATEAVQEGAKVTATVYCDAHLARQAEEGDVYDRGNVSPGTFFFSAGVEAVRARLL